MKQSCKENTKKGECHFWPHILFLKIRPDISKYGVDINREI